MQEANKIKGAFEGGRQLTPPPPPLFNWQKKITVGRERRGPGSSFGPYIVTPPPISDPRVSFWDADFKPPEGSLIWTVPSMQCKGKWLKNIGGHLLGRLFWTPPKGQLFGHGYASGHGSLISGGVTPPPSPPIAAVQTKGGGVERA